MLPVNKKSALSKFFDFGSDSFDLFDNMTETFDKFFGECGCGCCHADVDGNVVYQMEVPGFNKDNLKVEVADGCLTIRGNREVRDKNYVGKSQIHKRLTVGDVEDAEAEVKDGILTLKLRYPKTEPSEPAKQIEIKG